MLRNTKTSTWKKNNSIQNKCKQQKQFSCLLRNSVTKRGLLITPPKHIQGQLAGTVNGARPTTQLFTPTGWCIKSRTSGLNVAQLFEYILDQWNEDTASKSLAAFGSLDTGLKLRLTSILHNWMLTIRPSCTNAYVNEAIFTHCNLCQLWCSSRHNSRRS